MIYPGAVAEAIGTEGKRGPLRSITPDVTGLNDADQILVNTYRPGLRILGHGFFRKPSACLCDPNGGCTAVEALLAERKDVFYFNASGLNSQGHLVGTLFVKKGVGEQAERWLEARNCDPIIRSGNCRTINNTAP